MKWEEEKWLRLKVAELLERLPTERAAGAREFAEWLHNVKDGVPFPREGFAFDGLSLLARFEAEKKAALQ